MKYPSVYPLNAINKLTLCQKHHISSQNGSLVTQIEYYANICYKICNFFSISCALEFIYIFAGMCEHPMLIIRNDYEDKLNVILAYINAANPAIQFTHAYSYFLLSIVAKYLDLCWKTYSHSLILLKKIACLTQIKHPHDMWKMST